MSSKARPSTFDRKMQVGRRRRVIGILAALAVTTALVAGYMIYRQRTRMPLIEVVPAMKGEIVQTVSATIASIQPRVEILAAAEQLGRVVQLRARLGQLVKQGDIIAILEDEVLQAQVSQAKVDVEKTRRNLQNVRARTSEVEQVAKAEVSQAQVNVEETRKDLERTRVLRATDVTSESELEDADFRYKSAVAAIEIAKARQKQLLFDSNSEIEHAEDEYKSIMASLEILEARNEQLTVRAPIGGTVTQEHVQPGNVLAFTTNRSRGERGFSVVTISTMGDLVVKAYVDEADILKLRQGQQALIAIEALGGNEITGLVKSVAPSPSERAAGTTYEVIIELTEHPDFAVAGVRASVRIVVARKDEAIHVPREAVFSREEHRYLFILRGGRAQLRQVETGIADVSHIEVSSGLTEGEQIIIGFPSDLADGAQVATRRMR